MIKINRIFFSFITNICLVSLLTSCGDSTTNSSLKPSEIDNSPVGESEASGLWVNVSSDDYLYYINKESEWGSNCSISSTTTNNEVISCLIDIPEGDLYNNEIKLSYNVPPGMCEHFSITPAWHWNESIGYGPKQVTFEVSKSSGTPVLTDLTNPGSSCNVTLEDNSVVDCSTSLELSGFDNSFMPSCVYDRSEEEFGRNCCFGNYTYVQHIDTDGDTTADETTSEVRSWGGDVKSCLGGIVRTSWDLFNVVGYPLSLLVRTSNLGYSNSLDIKSNSTTAVTNYSYNANYFEKTANPHNHNGYESAAISNLPYAVEPIDDLDGSLLVPGSDAFLFTCFDAAMEERHKIRVHIREWNTLEDFLVYGSTNGSTINDDVIGEEGINCQYDNGVGTGSPCNDFGDFDDILTGVGGNYTTDNTAPTAATDRRLLFPNVNY